MLTIRNLNEPFSLFENVYGEPFAVDLKKHIYHKDKNDAIYDAHPISKDGVVDYDSVVKIPKGELTPKAVKLN